MARYWKTWRFRLAVSLFVTSLIVLLWLSTKYHELSGNFLQELIVFQSVVALAIGLISAMLVGIPRRSLMSSLIVLSGVFFGTTVIGTVGLVAGLFVSVMMDQFSRPVDPYLPNLAAGIAGGVVWFFSQAIGAIWGGIDWLNVYDENRNSRMN